MAKKKVVKKPVKKPVAIRKTLKEQIQEEVKLQMPKVEVGVAVAVPNTVERKMEAICVLSEAVAHLAHALISTNTKIHISECHIANVKRGIDIK